MAVGDDSTFFLDIPPQYEMQFLEYFALDTNDKFLTEYITEPVILQQNFL